jgi:hypothetical protein
LRRRGRRGAGVGCRRARPGIVVHERHPALAAARVGPGHRDDPGDGGGNGQSRAAGR